MAYNFAKKTATFLILGLLLGFLITFIPRYKGDGEFIDRGLFTITERYRIAFEDFQLQKGMHQKTYRFKGVPKIPMNLTIHFNPSMAEANDFVINDFLPIVDSLDQYSVEVGITLIENKVEILYLPSQLLVDNWVMSSWYFWNERLVSIRLNPRSEYELIFSIEAQKELPDPIDVQLRLISEYGVMF